MLSSSAQRKSLPRLPATMKTGDIIVRHRQQQYPTSKDRVLLLDVDNVIFHHPKVLKKVRDNAVRFLHSHVDEKMDMFYAYQLNQLLYKTYGHTLIGLWEMYGSNATVEEFNAAVYDDELLDMFQEIKGNELTMHHSRAVSYLLRLMERMHVPVYLFSNAPLAWCERVVRTMRIDIHSRSWLCSDHPVFTCCTEKGMIKPMPELYHNVELYLEHEERFVDADIWFVDDSLVNLVPIINNPNWTPLLYSHDGMTLTPKSRVSKVGSLMDVANAIKHDMHKPL
jgi:FMN phosphatase YigB (HAD superfamily)